MDHLTDAPIANILILAGVIFLAVGLFGHIGGFIGSIFGNIEAGKLPPPLTPPRTLRTKLLLHQKRTRIPEQHFRSPAPTPTLSQRSSLLMSPSPRRLNHMLPRRLPPPTAKGFRPRA